MTGWREGWGGMLACACVLGSAVAAAGGTVMDAPPASPPEGSGIVWQVEAPPGEAPPVQEGTEEPSATEEDAGITGTYRGDLRFERLDDVSWQSVATSTSGAVGQADAPPPVFRTARRSAAPPPGPSRRRMVWVDGGESSWSIFRSLPVSGTVSMVFCLVILVAALFKGGH